MFVETKYSMLEILRHSNIPSAMWGFILKKLAGIYFAGLHYIQDELIQ